MGITERMQSRTPMLMEAALGERLKSEYHLVPDEQVALAGILYQPGGREALKRLWQAYIDIAAAHHLPILLTTPTRRVNRERAEHFPHRNTVISDHVALLRELQRDGSGEVYIGGLMGCRGDAYTGKGCLSTGEALDFHRWQAEQFQNSPMDFLMAGILPTLPEAMGLAQAMSETGFPYLISFTIQKDGCLIDGTTISDAIETIDQFVSRPPLGYMTNCVHPSGGLHHHHRQLRGAHPQLHRQPPGKSPHRHRTGDLQVDRSHQRSRLPVRPRPLPVHL